MDAKVTIGTISIFRRCGAIDDQEWELLKQVHKRKKVNGDAEYQMLISSRWVFEYRMDGES